MKALSLTQPWAHLVLIGQKTIETRTWLTQHRGDLLICATVERSRRVRETAAAFGLDHKQLVYGCALCVVDLYIVRPMTRLDEPSALCEITPGRVAWHLRNVRPVVPFKVVGSLGVFEADTTHLKFLPSPHSLDAPGLIGRSLELDGLSASSPPRPPR